MRIETEKVALVGAACVGKTTLHNNLKEFFAQRSDVGFVDEVGREFFQKNPTDPAIVFSLNIQSKLQDLILEKEQKVHELNPTFIFCDRSVLDSSVHLKAMKDEIGSEILLEHVRFWLPTYSYFLLLDPKDVTYKQDQIRRESEETRNSIHKAFIDLFLQHNIRFKLLRGSPIERVKAVNKILLTKNFLQ